jgi:hypothetical protein
MHDVAIDARQLAIVSTRARKAWRSFSMQAPSVIAALRALSFSTH